MLEFGKAKKLIKKAKTIYVCGHINPDGDSIGSAFAIYLALKKIGKDAEIILPKHADIFNFLPHIDDAKKTVEADNIDLLIAVDSSDIDRLSLTKEDIKKVKNVIMIDHHKRFKVYGDVNIIDELSPATSQIVYEFLKYMRIDIDCDIATYIYSGIITDTGSFNYSTTNKRTFEIASKLLDKGINFSDICRKLNNTMKESKLKLVAKTIENMEVYFGGMVRYSYVDFTTINGLGVDEEDAEGMTNYLRNVENTEVAIYVRGRSDGTYKVSLRSSEKIDSSEIAIMFGGGGHKRAAGYTITEDLEIAKDKLLKEIERILKRRD